MQPIAKRSVRHFELLSECALKGRRPRLQQSQDAVSAEQAAFERPNTQEAPRVLGGHGGRSQGLARLGGLRELAFGSLGSDNRRAKHVVRDGLTG